ncbi:MAG: ABC transporter ATP-binding protein [Dehalococcoidales bacterium]|nr:ABC transporter ATP-binding protein [Dehalococcoidales bacterium]
MLEVKNALKVYGEGEARVVALNNVSLRVNRGDYIAIMGPSGSGKSTLLNIIGGLDRISGGEVLLDGKRIDNLDENSLVEIRRRKIAYVFQQYHLLPSLTAVENVFMPLLFGGAKGETLEKALEILKMVGLEKRANHKPSQLSGGEQQRVAIARAIINNPSLILADEPTGNMDQKTGADILDIFDKLNKEGLGIIMVTHSPEVAKRAREIVFLNDGRIVTRIKRDANIKTGSIKN